MRLEIGKSIVLLNGDLWGKNFVILKKIERSGGGGGVNFLNFLI